MIAPVQWCRQGGYQCRACGPGVCLRACTKALTSAAEVSYCSSGLVRDQELVERRRPGVADQEQDPVIDAVPENRVALASSITVVAFPTVAGNLRCAWTASGFRRALDDPAQLGRSELFLQLPLPTLSARQAASLPMFSLTLPRPFSAAFWALSSALGTAGRPGHGGIRGTRQLPVRRPTVSWPAYDRVRLDARSSWRDFKAG
jgi:hypothetical protein